MTFNAQDKRSSSIRVKDKMRGAMIEMEPTIEFPDEEEKHSSFNSKHSSVPSDYREIIIENADSDNLEPKISD